MRNSEREVNDWLQKMCENYYIMGINSDKFPTLKEQTILRRCFKSKLYIIS